MNCSFCKNSATVSGTNFNGVKQQACDGHKKNLVSYAPLVPQENFAFGVAVSEHASTGAPTPNEPGPGPGDALRPFTFGGR